MQTTGGESVFSSAVSNTMQWALGYPVNAAHYGLTFLIIAVGGACILQGMAATFNARRYGMTFTVPTWGAGMAAIIIGMSLALIYQPESLAGSARIYTCLIAAIGVVLLFCGPVTMLVMSMSYGAAVSIWITALVGVVAISAGSTLVGSGMTMGQPKVLHWEGNVTVRYRSSNPWRQMNNERRVLEEGAFVSVWPFSAAIVKVEGYEILLMPGTRISIPKLGPKPKVVLEKGWMFSRPTLSANRNMGYETSSAGFKVSKGDVLLITGMFGTSVVVSDGEIRAGRNIYETETLVKKGHSMIIGPALTTNPQQVSKGYKNQIQRLTRYFENPFSAVNRAIITGVKEAAKKDEESKKPDGSAPANSGDASGK